MTSFAGRTVLLDANLLLLLLIGLVDRRLLGRNKRVRRYSEPEFVLLTECLRDAAALLTTQHVNAQTSDLGAGSLDGNYRTIFLALLRSIHVRDAAPKLVLETEEMSAPIQALDAVALDQLGVADAGLIQVALTNKCVLFTDDLQLYLQAQRRGAQAFKFSHLLN